MSGECDQENERRAVTVVPIRPKETKQERFERFEKHRLAMRREPHWCRACGWHITSNKSQRCRRCDNEDRPLRDLTDQARLFPNWLGFPD